MQLVVGLQMFLPEIGLHWLQVTARLKRGLDKREERGVAAARGRRVKRVSFIVGGEVSAMMEACSCFLYLLLVGIWIEEMYWVDRIQDGNLRQV
jgi:hypothetical protein